MAACPCMLSVLAVYATWCFQVMLNQLALGPVVLARCMTRTYIVSSGYRAVLSSQLTVACADSVCLHGTCC